MKIKNPPLLYVKAKIHTYIAQRSTSLVLQANKGEITEKEYLQRQLPAEMGSMIEDWFAQAIAEYEKDFLEDEERIREKV